MKLKSDLLFWPQIADAPQPVHGALNRDLSCDIAIIGGGISGALCAYYLTAAGFHSVLVDRRQPASGSTPASTGLLQYEIDTPLIDLAGMIGKDRAIAAYQASVDALLAFEPLVEELGDRCGLVARPSLYLATEQKDVEKLRAECEARRSMKIDVEFLVAPQVRENLGLDRPAALRSKHGFEVDPFRLTLRLIDRAMQKGLEVFGETEISRHIPQSRTILLETAAGPRIEARHVVFATGYETMGLIPSDLCRLSSTYALASEPIAHFTGWPDRSLIWEMANPYFYLRTTRDDRAIIGGEDVDIVEPRARDRLIESKARTLREKCAALLPRIHIDVACAWAGTFAQTADGLPYIGALPRFPHTFFALGYGGNGITFSLLAAEMIRDALRGKKTLRSSLFRFDR